MVEKLRKKAATLFLIFTCFVGLNFYDIGLGYNTEAKKNNARTPDEYVWPVPGHTQITSYYNEKHKGIEIESDGEVEIVAVKDGKVIEAESTVCKHEGKSYDYCCNNGMGNYVRIKHDDGLISEYLHLKYNSVTVKSGDNVKAGEVIGLMGNSGRSAKQHLYFQLGYSSTNTIDINPGKIDYVYKEIDKSNEYNTSTVWQVKPNVMLNMRKGIGVDYDVITTINENEQFMVADIKLYDEKEWGQVSYDGYIGWCSLEYAVKIQDNKDKIEDKSTQKNEELKEKNKITEEKCSLTYNTCGGEMDCSCRTYLKNSKITILDKPTKEGYVFSGWYADEDYTELVTKGYIVKNDMNLYAYWTQ